MRRFGILLPRGEVSVSVLRFPQSVLISLDDGTAGPGSLAVGVPPLPSALSPGERGAGLGHLRGESSAPAALTLSAEPFASCEQLESLAEKATVIMGAQCFLRVAIGDSRLTASPTDLQTMELRLLEGLRSLAAD